MPRHQFINMAATLSKENWLSFNNWPTLKPPNWSDSIKVLPDTRARGAAPAYHFWMLPLVSMTLVKRVKGAYVDLPTGNGVICEQGIHNVVLDTGQYRCSLR